MKAAVLISGRPRFTKDFDNLIHCFEEYDQIDWFIHVWKSDHSTDMCVPPSWNNERHDFYRKLINSLPKNNYVAHIDIVDEPVFDTSKHYYEITKESNYGPAAWAMFNGFKQVNSIREKYESVFGEYDLVIRARGDCSLTNILYLNRVNQYLTPLTEKTIIMPDSGRLGFVPYGMTLNPVNDQFAIGKSSVMSIYFNVFDNIDQYTQEGIPFTGESMLGYHLLKNNILTPPGGFEAILKQHKLADQTVDFGRWI